MDEKGEEASLGVFPGGAVHHPTLSSHDGPGRTEGLGCLHLRGMSGRHRVVKGCTPEKLLDNFLVLLVRLLEKGGFVVADKGNLFTTSVTWCRKVYSSDSDAHLPQRIIGLVNMRMSVTTGGVSCSFFGP